MRLWEIRVTFEDGTQDYMELDFGYKRHAYDFAWSWFEEDPTLRRITASDSRERAETLRLWRD